MVVVVIMTVIYYLLNPLFILLISPLFYGLSKKIKPMAQGRTGAPVWQPYFTLHKLFKKEIIYSETLRYNGALAPIPEHHRVHIYGAVLSLVRRWCFYPRGQVPQISSCFLYPDGIRQILYGTAGLDSRLPFLVKWAIRAR